MDTVAKLCPCCDITTFGNYCHTCGTVLIPQISDPRCPYCGEEISKNDYYCRNCGKRIEEAE